MDSSSSDSQQQDPFARKYIRVQKIAAGTYGVVWKAKDSQTGQFVAIKKFINLGHEGLPVSAVREIHIIKNLKSDHILTPIQLNIKTKSVSMVTQWKDLTLSRLIKTSTVYNSKNILKQIIKATGSIHGCFIMHRDLKPANIVLDDEQGKNLKIIDFGMAKEIKWNPKLQLTNQVGTQFYRAPELLAGSTKYHKSIDVWSIGCIFYELLTKEILFKSDSQFNQLLQIYEDVSTEAQAAAFMAENKAKVSSVDVKNWSRIRASLQSHPAFSLELDLLQKLLKINPKQRLSCEQALGHPYLAQ